jgi:uncharacterized protein (DUF362 family)
VSRNAPTQGPGLGRFPRLAGLAAGLFFAVAAGAAPLFSTAGKAVSARVVIVQDARATEAFQPRPEVVQAMLDEALRRLTGSNDVAAAWGGLVTPRDMVGLKVYSLPGPNSGTRPAVVEAVIQGLLAAHVPANHIIIWDRRLADLRHAGYGRLAARYGVRLEGSWDAGYDEKAFYETALLGNLRWGDLEFEKQGEGVGRKSFVTKVVTQDLTKIINITPLLNNYDTGVAGNLYGLTLGSVDNTARFEADPDRLDTAVPEIYALPQLGDRVVLNIVDALLCQYEGSQEGKLHYSVTLNQLRVSRDPVALDVLSVAELARQRAQTGFPAAGTNRLLFQNASLLELGVSDPQKIQVERFNPPARDEKN